MNMTPQNVNLTYENAVIQFFREHAPSSLVGSYLSNNNFATSGKRNEISNRGSL